MRRTVWAFHVFRSFLTFWLKSEIVDGTALWSDFDRRPVRPSPIRIHVRQQYRI